MGEKKVAPLPPEERLLTIVEVAARLGLSDPATVRGMTMKQGLRFVRVGRLLRFRPEWVEEFIDKAGRR